MPCRTLLTVAALLLPALAGAPAAAKGAAEPATLIRQWSALNDTCRGGSGDNPATITACDRREAVGRQLDDAGWCHGRRGEAGYQMTWHRCGPRSIRQQ